MTIERPALEVASEVVEVPVQRVDEAEVKRAEPLLDSIGDPKLPFLEAVRAEIPEYDLLPSEYFRRQMYGSFWFEQASMRSAVEQLGADCILYETDFPHPTSMAPGPATTAVSPRDYIADSFAGLPEEARRLD